jgi:hypothetical protein
VRAAATAVELATGPIGGALVTAGAEAVVLAIATDAVRRALAERAPGADARERPWRATARYTAWESDSADPAARAAADQLDAAILGEYTQRAREYLATRADEPGEWRRAAGFGDVLAHLTAAELAQLTAEIDALMRRFDDRLEDPSRRPAGARAVQIIRMAVPRD